MNKLEQRVIAVLVALVVIGLALTAATAVLGSTIDIPINTVHRGDPGDLFHQGTVAAQPGDECTAELEGRNNESIHPDSDILVGPIVFADVEDGAFQAAGLAFTATGPVEVFVRLGADGVFSAGFTLEVTCNPPEQPDTTTTTRATSSSTTMQPPVTSEPPPVTPTTLSEPPVGGVDTGGGACAKHGCGSLSPLLTWVLIGVVWSLLAGLAWAFIHGATRRHDG